MLLCEDNWPAGIVNSGRSVVRLLNCSIQQKMSENLLDYRPWRNVTCLSHPARGISAGMAGLAIMVIVGGVAGLSVVQFCNRVQPRTRGDGWHRDGRESKAVGFYTDSRLKNNFPGTIPVLLLLVLLPG